MFISKNDTFRFYRQALSLFKSSQGIHLEEPTNGFHGVEAEDRGFDIRSGGWGGGGEGAGTGYKSREAGAEYSKILRSKTVFKFAINEVGSE